MATKCWLVVGVCALGLAFSAPTLAQVNRATISGTVTDSSGAALPGVSIIITGDSGVVLTALTNQAGEYTVPSVPVGTYSVKFEMTGFKTHMREKLTLQVSQTLRVDAELEVGRLTETVSVSGTPQIIQRETPEVGTTVSREYLTMLPLSMGGGRYPETFAYKLTAGVEGGTWTSRINGSPAFSKEVLLEGASVTTYLSGHFGESSVSMEALQEFKIQTSGLSAEYGRTAGGVFNFVMRSGQNQAHGTGFSTFRHEALNANTFLNNAAGRPKGVDRQSNYGGSFGGAVRIPGVYDGHNRTFFFVAAEKFRVRSYVYGAPNRSVPQLEMYDGNLSRLLTTTVVGTDALGRPIYRGAIYDPLTLKEVNGGFVADPFPNNIVPQNRISQVSRRIGDIARQHYAPMNDALTANNLFPTQNTPEFDQNQWSFKIDQVLSSRQRLSGSLARNTRPRLLLDAGGIWDGNDPIGGPLSTARRQVINSWLVRTAHEFTISPTLFNSLIVSFNRMANPNRSAHVADGCGALLGIAGVRQDGPCPRINWGAGPAGVSFDPIGDPQDDFQAYNAWGIANALSWSKGHHFMKFGVDLRGNQLNTRPLGNLAGTFNFTAAQTGIPGVNLVGHSFASFLLGGIQSASVGVPLGLGGRTAYYAAYAQDDFKVTPKLTLQLGVRFEYQPPALEQYDRTSNFDLTVRDPLTGMMGAVVFAGDGTGRTGRRTFVDSEKTDFGPRLGAAYTVTERTSLRGGYGIFYGANVFNGFSSVPFSRGFGGTNNISNPLAHTSVFSWDNGYPDAFVAPAIDPTSWRLGGVTHWDPDAGRVPRTHQWNANVQREVMKNLTVDVGYLGTRSSHLWAGDLANKNQLDPKYLSFEANLQSILRTDADAQRFGLSGLPYPAFTGGQLWQALVPFPHLARNGIGLTTFNSPLGRSSYDSLQITVNRRYTNGLTVYGNYNFSRTLQNMESALRNDNPGRPLDYYNLDREFGLSDFDQTHNWKISTVYEIPFGRNRRFGASIPAVLDAILGGWTVSFIGNYASGTPLRFTGSAIPGWNGRANLPDLINPNGGSLLAGFESSKFNAAAIAQGNYADHRWIAPGLLVDHAPFTLGNAPIVVDVREPYFRNEDVSIQKTFRAREMRIQLRGELLNAFNRHTFGGIVTNVLDARFGQITSVSGNRQGQIGLRLEF
jgi:Carboxypeptidase regulatory-like domain/TonB dependent receptor-like, beta-barrel